MSTIVKLLHMMLRRVEKTEVDARKFDNGNISAGVRVRKQMQKVRKEAKTIRKEIQKGRKKRKGKANG